MNIFDQAIFKSPSRQFRPLTRWWWTALDVTIEELMREVAEMDDKGFYGCEIQTLASMDPTLQQRDPGRYAREHRYASEFYFETVREVMSECRNCEMIVDVTVGSCWPIGGTCVSPEDSLKTLIMGAVTVDGGQLQQVKLPTASQTAEEFYDTLPQSPFVFLPPVVASPEMKKALRLIRVTAARLIGNPGTFTAINPQTALLDINSVIDLTAYVDGDNTLIWNFPEGCWQVFVAFAGPVYAEIMTDAKEEIGKPSLVLDHFKAGAIEKILDHYIARGNFQEYAGQTFRSFFSDSFELDTQCFWADNFLEEFQSRRGYDLSPFLPVIFVPERDSRDTVSDKGYIPSFDFTDGQGDRIRRDFETTVADLFRENMLLGLKNWGEKHGLQSKVQCYGHAMDNLQSFGLTHIPETEQLAASGGIDFMKLAGSAALLYGQSVVSAESLVWGDQDYQVNPMKIKVASDRLFVSGVNQMIYHGWPYQHPAASWPGSFPFHGFVGTFISRNDAIWPWLRDVNMAVARGQYLMRSGETVIDVAVLDRNIEHQYESGRAEELATGVLDGIDRESDLESVFSHQDHQPRTEWQKMAEESRCLGNDLMEAGFDYAHINEERLLAAILSDEGLLEIGKAHFKVLIVPAVRFMSLATAVKIQELSDHGFPVLFCDFLPDTVPGFYEFRQKSAELMRTLQKQIPTGRKDLISALKKAGVQPGIASESEGLQHIHKKIGDLDLYFVRSRLPAGRMVRLTMAQANRQARLLNTWSGTISEVKTTSSNGLASVELPLAAYGSAYLLFGDEASLPQADESGELAVATASVSGKLLQDLTADWSMAFRSAIPSVQAQTININKMQLGDWSDMDDMKNHSGTGTYSCSFSWTKDSGRAALDLGIVGDIACVSVNGSKLPPMLIYPYAAEITDLLHEGSNELVVEITNSLRNGMIGANLFDHPRGHALSGLIGPVRLLTIDEN